MWSPHLTAGKTHSLNIVSLVLSDPLHLCGWSLWQQGSYMQPLQLSSTIWRLVLDGSSSDGA